MYNYSIYLRESFGNINGLTLSRVHNKEAVMKYVSKKDTRVKGPFYVGRKEKFDERYATMILRPWQKELYDFILINKNNPIIRERKIIWVENNKGCRGKSKFQKWLRLGQRNVIA